MGGPGGAAPVPIRSTVQHSTLGNKPSFTAFSFADLLYTLLNSVSVSGENGIFSIQLQKCMFIILYMGVTWFCIFMSKMKLFEYLDLLIYLHFSSGFTETGRPFA